MGYSHRLISSPSSIRKTVEIWGGVKSLPSHWEGESDIRLPISQPVLHKLVGSLSCQLFGFSSYNVLCDVLTSILWLFLMMELATRSATSGGAEAQYSNLRFLTQQGSVCMTKTTVTNFKHNTDHSPFHILIAREDLLPLCPVQAMVEFCKLSGAHAGPLLCHSDTSPITEGQLSAERNSCALEFLWSRYVPSTKVIVFDLGLPVMRPTAFSLMLKFAHLAAGNPLALNFSLGPTACLQIDTP